MVIERRPLELRADGRRLVGAAMRYGAEAHVVLPDGRAVVESFRPGAFAGWLADGGSTSLNLAHDRTLTLASTDAGTLELQDGREELRMVATLPDGAAFDDALALVADGSLRETSVEFRAVADRIEAGRRTVHAAALPAISVVPAGAYGAAGTVEIRARGAGVGGRVHYDRNRVTADRGRRRKQRIRPGAFRHALRDPDREITLQIGDDAGAVLGSRKAGSLTLQDGPAGLDFEVPRLPSTTAVRDFAALLDAGTIRPGVVPFFRVPPADVVPDAVTYEADPEAPGVEIEVIRRALLTALSIRYRAPRGAPGVVERRAAERPCRWWWL